MEQAEALEALKQKLYLVARTEGLSPPLITLLFGMVAPALAESIVSRIVDWGIDSVRSRIAERREKNELWLDLFWLCRNADFFVGRIDHRYGLKAAEELVECAIGIFGDRPEHKKEGKWLDVDFGRNLVSIGGPDSNEFSRFYIEHYPLPYKFNMEQFPWTIMDTQTKVDTYIPEVYPEGKLFVYVKDYAMIIRGSSMDPKARREGRKVLIVAGTHRIGTMGAASALREVSVLRELWNETRGKDFQAIFSVDIESSEFRNVVLIETKVLGIQKAG